jgi:hypothetical protein
MDFVIVKNYVGKYWGDCNPNILTNIGGVFHLLKITWASVEVILFV